MQVRVNGLTRSYEGVTALDAPVAAAAATARAELRPDSLKDALDRSSSVRAGSLALRCDDGSFVHLDGPVAVLAGSREVWTGCTLPLLPRASASICGSGATPRIGQLCLASAAWTTIAQPIFASR